MRGYFYVGALCAVALLCFISFNKGVSVTDLKWEAAIAAQKQEAASQLAAIKEQHREKERQDAIAAIEVDKIYQNEIARLTAGAADSRSELERRVRRTEARCGGGSERGVPSTGADTGRASDPPTGGELGFYRIDNRQLSNVGEGGNRLAAWAKACFAHVNGLPPPVSVQ